MRTLLRKTSSTCFTKRGISAASGHSELHHVRLTYRHPQILGAEDATRGTVVTSQFAAGEARVCLRTYHRSLYHRSCPACFCRYSILIAFLLCDFGGTGTAWSCEQVALDMAWSRCKGIKTVAGGLCSPLGS